MKKAAELLKRANRLNGHLKAGGTGYGRLFQTLAAAVDDVTDANKALQRKAKRALDDIKNRVREDQEFQEKYRGTLNAEAPAQHFDEFMPKALKAADDAADELEWAYDQMNRVFLNLGLK